MSTQKLSSKDVPTQEVILIDSTGAEVPGLIIPTGATSVQASSGNVAAAVAAAALPAVSGKTNYLSGFKITGAGSTSGLPVTVTITGLLGGTASYTYTFATGVTVGNQPLIVDFDPPLPASAVNTAITVSCPSGGTGNTNNTTHAHGYVK